MISLNMSWPNLSMRKEGIFRKGRLGLGEKRGGGVGGFGGNGIEGLEVKGGDRDDGAGRFWSSSPHFFIGVLVYRFVKSFDTLL